MEVHNLDVALTLIGLLAGTALLIHAVDVVLGGRMQTINFARNITNISIFTALIIAVLSLLNIISSENSVPNLIRNDGLGFFFSIVVLLVSLFVSISSFDYIRKERNELVYYSLLLFTTLGMVALSFAVDLLVIFIAWELMSLPTFILVGFRKNDKNALQYNDSVLSNEGAVKYFILGALSSAILLYGISLIFGLTGSTNLDSAMNSIINLDPNNVPLAILGVVSLIAGFGLKLSIVPFHMWIPDAYEGAPITVGALLSSATKKVGFVAAIRSLIIIFPIVEINLSMILAIIALFTMTLGNIAALTQKTITRLLAYSSIAQAGYLLIGLVVLPTSSLGLVGLLYHSFNHAVMQASAFLAAAAVSYKLSKTSLNSYDGLAKIMPITAFCLAISLLALAGIPPLNGFWSKVVLFAAAVEGGYTWLALAGLVNTVISVGYYGLIVKRMYMDDPSEKKPLVEPKSIISVLIFATIIIIITGLVPNVLLDYITVVSDNFLSNYPALQ